MLKLSCLNRVLTTISCIFMIFDDFGRKWLGILRLRPISKAFSKGKIENASIYWCPTQKASIYWCPNQNASIYWCPTQNYID